MAFGISLEGPRGTPENDALAPFELYPLPLVVVDLETGAIVAVNAAAEAQYGYGSGEMVGVPAVEIRVPAERERFRAVLRRLAAGDGSFRSLGYWRYLRRDGSEFDALVHARTLWFRGRQCVVALAVDVTAEMSRRRAQEQAERALAASERRFRALIERSIDAVVLLDAQGVVTYATAALERVLGYRPEQLVGRAIRSLWHDDDEAGLREIRERVMSAPGNVAGTTGRLRHADGYWCWVEGSASNLCDDPDVQAVVLNLRDVSARRRAEAERDRILDVSPAMLAMLDRDGHFVRVNRAWERTLGWTVEDLHGKTSMDLLHPDDAAEAIACGSRVQNGEIATFTSRCLARDGSYRYLEWTATACEEEGLVYAAAHDATARLALEDQLRHAQKMEAVGRLAGGVAHDFNNILSVILSCSEFLIEALPEGDPRRADALDVRAAGERAAVLTRQLLAFSRRQVMQAVPTDLNVLVVETCQMVARTIGVDVRVSTRLAPALPKLIADPGQLVQVLLNLMVNARDAMPAGGEIAVETAPAELDGAAAAHLGEVSPGPYVRLTVRDSGCGMDRETLGKIFEPFFTTKETGKGTGLGLSTVFGIVKQSGGAIEVRSEPGSGTTFDLWFPAGARGTESVAPPAPNRPPGVRRRGTVLVVEDEPQVRAVARRILEAQGFRVLEAGDVAGAAALWCERGASVELLLTDLVVPGGGTLEFAERLREERPSLPVVYMSGYTEPVVPAGRGLEPGVNYLQKPFAGEALASMVRRALGG